VTAPEALTETAAWTRTIAKASALAMTEPETAATAGALAIRLTGTLARMWAQTLALAPGTAKTEAVAKAPTLPVTWTTPGTKTLTGAKAQTFDYSAARFKA
jgi:hypothetical protein